MDRVKNLIIISLLGILFAYASIIIIGYGAAIAIPVDLLGPLVKSSPYLAFATIDLLTLGLPLASCFMMLALLIKLIKVNTHHLCYVLLALPFLLLLCSILIMSFLNSENVYFLATTLPKYILLAMLVFAITRLRLRQKTKDAQPPEITKPTI